MIKYRIILPNGYTESESEEYAEAIRDQFYPDCEIIKVESEAIEESVDVKQGSGATITEIRLKEIETLDVAFSDLKLSKLKVSKIEEINL